MTEIVKIITFLIAAVALLFIGISGGLLPTWIFINSASLLMHIPLFNTGLPADLHYFLTKYLDLLRLNIPRVEESIELM